MYNNNTTKFVSKSHIRIVYYEKKLKVPLNRWPNTFKDRINISKYIQ